MTESFIEKDNTNDATLNTKAQKVQSQNQAQAQLQSPTYLVNEIYTCLQGEGVNLGKPSLLVRFQVCNLRCTWCDSAYTHTPRSDTGIVRYTLEDLCTKIKSYENFNHLILTGGEPTLYNLAKILKYLGPSYSAEVESNGTQIPHLKFSDFLSSDYKLMQWNISPKFENAGQKLDPAGMQFWSQMASENSNIFFKFVLRKNKFVFDSETLIKIITDYKIPSSKVLVMPEGVLPESQMDNIWLHDFCMKHGFRYTPRLHVMLFGNQRSV